MLIFNPDIDILEQAEKVRITKLATRHRRGLRSANGETSHARDSVGARSAPALGIEARRAETLLGGSVYESPASRSEATPEPINR